MYKNPKKIELGDTSTILNKSLINRIRNTITKKLKVKIYKGFMPVSENKNKDTKSTKISIIRIKYFVNDFIIN